MTRRLNAQLDTIFALVSNTFILPWYTRISPSPAFPNAMEILVRQVLIDLVSRAEAVDWSIVIVSRILPLVKDHLHHYRSVEHLTSTVGGPLPNPALPLPLPLNAHPALSSEARVSVGAISPLVEAYLGNWLGRLLNEAMPISDRSEVVMTLVREIMLGAALLPTFNMLCDHDFWNQQIDERAGKYLHEQYVSRLNAMVRQV